MQDVADSLGEEPDGELRRQMAEHRATAGTCSPRRPRRRHPRRTGRGVAAWSRRSSAAW